MIISRKADMLIVGDRIPVDPTSEMYYGVISKIETLVNMHLSVSITSPSSKMRYILCASDRVFVVVPYEKC